MQIKISSPAMAVNAAGTQPYFNMDENVIIGDDVAPVILLHRIREYARTQEGGSLNALVIHCHGLGWAEGGIQVKDRQFFADWKFGYGLGIGTGIKDDQTKLFEMLSEKESDANVRKGIIENIYLTGCGIAQITPEQGERRRGDGNLFCGAMAKAAGAHVYASLDEQTGWSLPSLGIREWRAKNEVIFDGIVLHYRPDGSNERVA